MIKNDFKIDIKIKTLLIVFLIFLCLLQFFLESLDYAAFTSILFYLSFILVFILWIYYDFTIKNKINLLIILILLLSFINSTVELIINEGEYVDTYYNKVLFLAMFLISFKLALTKIDVVLFKKWFYLLLFLFSIGYIYIFFFRNGLIYRREGEYRNTYLTFNLENPNKCALFVVFMALGNFVALSDSEKFIRKVFFLTFFVFFLYCIYLTGSRNGMLSLAIFLVFILINLFSKKTYKVRMHWIINLIFALLPIIFAIFYLLTVYNSDFNSMFGFLVTDGKSLDSRYSIWKENLEKFLTNPIFGVGYEISSTGLFQLHNTHIDVLVGFGAIVFGFYILFLWCILNEISNKKSLTKKKAVFYFAIIIMIMLGDAEAAMVNGGNGLCILASSYIILCSNS